MGRYTEDRKCLRYADVRTAFHSGLSSDWRRYRFPARMAVLSKQVRSQARHFNREWTRMNANKGQSFVPIRGLSLWPCESFRFKAPRIDRHPDPARIVSGTPSQRHRMNQSTPSLCTGRNSETDLPNSLNPTVGTRRDCKSESGSSGRWSRPLIMLPWPPKERWRSDIGPL